METEEEREYVMRRRERTFSWPAESDDGVLVRRVLAGDEQAFEVLMRRYNTLVSHCISRYLGDGDHMWDVIQQVWLRLYHSLPRLHTDGPLGPWLLTVAQRCCLDELRRRRRKRIMVFSELEGESDGEDQGPLVLLPDPHPLPEEVAEYHDLQAALERAIQTLPPRSQAVVRLRFDEQLSFAEIGERLHMPMTTAKVLFYRARTRLAGALAAEKHLSPDD
jgi:RNA polymerase sigma-70 factor (ECF subfamily)